MRTHNTETDTQLESITIKTYEGTEKRHYLSPTELCIFELIASFRFSLKDKIKLICHYQQELNFDLFNHLWDMALFVEQLKAKVKKEKR